jgi:hypothetical protein
MPFMRLCEDNIFSVQWFQMVASFGYFIIVFYVCITEL